VNQVSYDYDALNNLLENKSPVNQNGYQRCQFRFNQDDQQEQECGIFRLSESDDRESQKGEM